MTYSYQSWHLLCWLAAFLLLAKCTANAPDSTYSLTIRLDNARATRPDDLKCSATQLDPSESYILKVTPHASKETAHHMMVYGCEELPNSDPVWDCRDGETNGGTENSVCKGEKRQILFAWAMDAPEKALPEGVGIRVSGETKINYIVVQLHYADIFPDGVVDNSGVTLTMSNERPPMQAGYLVLANIGYIPPQQQLHPVESSCTYERNYTIYPIGYRTHAHELGYVTAGYRVRDAEWTEIGRMSPQLPETFYEVSSPGMDIRKGDELASRCTMNSMARDEKTYIGATHRDEMCNFYIMYATYHQDILKTDICFQKSPEYKWADNFDISRIPDDVSTLKGVPNAEKVLAHFNMDELL